MELAAPPTETTETRIRWDWLIPIGLFLLAVAIYIHSANYELFYSWDDNRYIAENMLLRNFSLGGLKDIWTQVYFAAYIPVTITSYWLEFHLWGMSPAGYHVVNVLLNGFNTALVYVFLLKLLRNRNVALMATLLWIVHPLQVETVVWVAERKSLLAMFFTLLSFIAYMRSADEGAPRWTLPAAYVLFFLGAFAKPAVVGVPLLFMAYDYFYAKMSLRRVIARAIVPLLIGGASAVTIVLAHKGGGGIKEYWGGSPIYSGLLMLMVFWDYVVSFVAPWKLDNFYRYDSSVSAAGQLPAALMQNPISIALGVLLLVSFVYIAWKQPFGKPFSFFAILWIVLLMLPVVNIIPIAIERADRYMYFPSIVVFAIVAILIDRLWQRLSSPGARYAIAGVFAALIVLLTGVTYARSLVWQNEGLLWTDHLSVYPKSQTGWLNLGVYYWNKKDYDHALPVFRQLVSLSPNDFKGNRFLGHIAIAQNRFEDAVLFYRKALATSPKDGGTFSLLGLAYFRLQDYSAAINAYTQAIRLDPTLNNVYANLGTSALRAGKYDLAVQALTKAVAQNPRDANSISDLCTTLSQVNRTADAIGYCQTAVKLQPNNGFYLGRLASLYLDTNQPDKALPVAQQAAQVAPNASLSFRVLGEAYADLGQKDRAIAALQKSLQLDSGNGRAQQVLNSLNGS